MSLSPDPNPTLDGSGRAGRMGGRLANLVVVAAVVIVAGFLWIAVSPSALTDFLRREILTPEMPLTLTAFTHAALIAVLAVPLGVALAVLWTTRQLFTGFARGEVFTAETGRRLRRIGALLLVLQVVKIVVGSLGTLIATLPNPPGARHLSIGLSSDHLIVALVGGLLIAVGWAMAEAARLADENRGFV
jgi:hypothetical protein